MEPTPTASPDEQIEIPPRAVIACPLVGFELRLVADCATCKHFGGLEDRFPGAPFPFHRRYTVICSGEPAKRQVTLLSEVVPLKPEGAA